MNPKTFEYAIFHNECDVFFKGKGVYYIRSDRGEHEYGLGMQCALSEVNNNKVSSSEFVSEFTKFVNGLDTTESDLVHFYQNLYFYFLCLYKYKSITKDIVFSDEEANKIISDLLERTRDTLISESYIPYIVERFPRAKILPVIEKHKNN
ncbi:hypothetical protein AB4259_00870 [Vibrio amylolyticus]|uniref:hypothetical protein n=1 Tax=Vibrio amylolyticus TaxID=2847292 RepID=UPI0035531D51